MVFLFMQTNSNGAETDNGSGPSRTGSSDTLPNSKKVYVAGKQYVDLRVPFREISLAPTKTMSGEIEVNEPVRVYDTSGPWGDPDAEVDVTRGLAPLRAKWIRDRGDVEEIEGRPVSPQDNGYLSEKHAAERNGDASPARTSEVRFQRSAKNKALRAKPGKTVTQLWYARQGIITPEMEFIAIRENGRANSFSSVGEAASFPSNDNREANSLPYSRNDLRHQHIGESFGAYTMGRDARLLQSITSGSVR